MGSSSNDLLSVQQVDTPKQKHAARYPSPFESTYASVAGSSGTIAGAAFEFVNENLYDTLSFCTEAARLQGVHSCGLLDSAPEHRFDAITELAACLFDAPVSVVSLLDADRGWFKSRYGPVGPCVDREGTFCSYILVPEFKELLIVEDCTADARFSSNPFVLGPPQLRYYCSCPLVITKDQMRIGTLCVTDFKPRHFPAQTYNVLVNLGELVCREIERGPVTSQQLAQKPAASDAHAGNDSPFAAAAATAAAPAACEPVFLVNVAASYGWEVLYGNAAWREITGIPEDARPPLGEFWEFFEPVSCATELENVKEKMLRLGQPATMLLQLRDEFVEFEEQQQLFSVRFLLASRDQLENALPVSVPAFVAPDERSVPAPICAKLSLPLDSLWIGTMQPVIVTRDDAPSSLSRSLSRLSSSSTFSPRTSASISGQYPSKPLHLADLELGPLMGQGSFGKVYRGQLGEKTIAIKVMLLPAVGSEALESVLKESALCRNLAHPNIVPTLEYFIHHQRQEMWILQHFCDRGSLYDVLDRGLLRQTPSLSSPASLPVVLATALDIASALRYLHDHDVIHGDVSGGNVLLSSANNARGFVAMVNDFGLSTVNAREQQMQMFGTISHMPPEMLRDGVLTKATDVYAFGVLLWEIWAGKRAWAGFNPLRLIFLVGDGKAGLEMPADAPAAVKSLADACLKRELTERPTMGEVVERLEAAIAALPS